MRESESDQIVINPSIKPNADGRCISKCPRTSVLNEGGERSYALQQRGGKDNNVVNGANEIKASW